MNAKGLATLNLGLFFLVLTQPQPLASPLGAAALAGLAIAVEVAAPYVQLAGFLSLAGGLYLALGVMPQGSLAMASLAAMVGLLVRAVARGSRDPATRWNELLPDSMGIGAALALAWVVLKMNSSASPGVVFLTALVGYVVGQVVVVGILVGFVDQRVNTLRAVQTLLVWALAVLVQQSAVQPLGALAALPLLALAYLLAPRLGQSHHLAEMVQREHRLAQRSVESISERMDLLRQDHQQRSLERELFSNFAHAFARDPSPKATYESIIVQVARAVKSDNAYLFVPIDGRLAPVASHDLSVLAELRGKAAGGVSEPVVEECFKRARQLRKKPKPAGGKPATLLASSDYALAMPLNGQGVLYLGWSRPPSLTSEALNALLTLSELAAIALSTAEGLAEVQRELVYQSAGHIEARVWVERFDILLSAVRSLAGHLSTQEVLETLRQLAGHLVAHDSGAIVVRLGEGERVLAWPTTPDPALLAGYVDAVLAAGRPLLGPPAGGAPVWPLTVTAPIMADESALGAIILGRGQGEFTTEEQESLSLGAVQMAMMLEKARMYEEVVDSRRRLQESQAQLVSSSKLAAVGQLAAGVAHELNTPLGALLLRLESANRSIDKGNLDGARKNLQVAETALLSARDIVAKLLAYSHDRPQQPVPVALREVMTQAVTLVEGQLSTQQVKLSHFLEASDCQVLGNPNELSQVIINLVLNARDAILSSAPKGEISIRVRQHEREVQIEVEDSGPGIPTAIRDRVFDPFFTTKPVGVGTGLGLSVSRQIIAGHQGELRLLDGLPTRFRISLPLL